jgi:hypothetical protein
MVMSHGTDSSDGRPSDKLDAYDLGPISDRVVETVFEVSSAVLKASSPRFQDKPNSFQKDDPLYVTLKVTSDAAISNLVQSCCAARLSCHWKTHFLNRCRRLPKSRKKWAGCLTLVRKRPERVRVEWCAILMRRMSC